MVRILTADKIVEIEAVVKDRIVQFDDIVDSVCIKYDDSIYDTPWENCDGWDHEFVGTGYFDHPNASQRTGYVNRSARYGGCGHIIVDEKDLYAGYPGCSKQVRAESIAASKRKMLEQLVSWYENGWEYYYVHGDYEDEGYIDSIGGIDCIEYAEEMRQEIADNIADQMESDGYIVEGRPEPVKSSPSDRYLENKKYLEKLYNPGNRSGCAKHGKRYNQYIQESIARRVAQGSPG